MRRTIKAFLKFGALYVVLIFAIIVMHRIFKVFSEEFVPSNFHDDAIFIKPNRIEMINEQPQVTSFFDRNTTDKNFIKIDWHDYRFIEMEQNRQGIGEHGVPEKIDEREKDEMDKLFRKNGFNALLSDRISVNRSVPDIRHKECKNKRYFAELPRVSIVVQFYNEYWSTLMRTIYSVLNRSPEKLIADIILVDDHSTREYLKEKLDKFIASYLPPKVKIVRLPKRKGLIAARLAGARIATGDVLVFLDSHVEANTNWLPPLLEPIATNYRYCICPLIDVIQHTSFEYQTQDEGARGGFDWFFLYQRFPLLPESKKNPTEIFESPVMSGGLFAISAKFFWELGGYDEGLDIWGGEQYELSFKIWQCGGKMYDARCSRVAHIYRGPREFEKAREGDYVSKNLKRVAEVWMDDYKQYLYDREPDRYNNLDPGDLTKQKELRAKLQCKPFKWFIENVAFDLVKKFPTLEPPDYASGAIQSVAFPELCSDTLGHDLLEEIGLFSCATNKLHPQETQYFSLSSAKDIRIKFHDICWDVSESIKNSRVLLYDCHGMQGNQLWHYDSEKQWIVHGPQRNRCLEADGDTFKVFVNPCNESNVNMKWEWGVVNGTALANYDKDN